MRRILQILVFSTLLFNVYLADAQVDRKEVRKGNKHFSKENYQEAEIDYKKALVKDSTSLAAQFNLANTYYKLENFPQAQEAITAIGDTIANAKNSSDIYHNLGNVYLKQKQYQQAIEEYKNSLRRNPDDMETKSNLAYAQKMLQNQQNQQNNNQNDDQNNDQNNDQNQDNQNQDNNENQDDQKDQNDQNDNQNNDDQDKNDQQDNDHNNDQNKDQNNDQNNNNPPKSDQQQNQGQQPKITPQAAQQMLQAIEDKERDTQEKVKKEKALMMKSKQKEKNW